MLGPGAADRGRSGLELEIVRRGICCYPRCICNPPLFAVKLGVPFLERVPKLSRRSSALRSSARKRCTESVQEGRLVVIAIHKPLSSTGVIVFLAGVCALAVGKGASLGCVHIWRAPRKETLLASSHLECPCSKAAIEGIAQLMASDGNLNPPVVFFTPQNSPECGGSDLCEDVRRIPGERVLSDRDGLAGQCFSARTSGQVLVYNSRGHLLFNGDLPPRRELVGPNRGFDAICAIVHGTLPKTQTSLLGRSRYGTD